MKFLIPKLLCLLSLTGCYTLQQAWHQNNLFNSRRLVSEVIADPNTEPRLAAKLRLTQSIIEYAGKQGLNVDDAYTYYIETGSRRVSYLVQAAHADQLKSVTWWFPFVGTVPYLGFFEEADRDAKAEDLRDAGYDVYETGVGAFSSLGWFSDPIFTSMLKRSRQDLASLYFHELTHRTFWISGSVKFNENLAEYVADLLTPRYLRDTGHEKLIDSYKSRRQDRKLYVAWLTNLKASLKKLYAKRKEMEPEKLLAEKERIYTRFTKNKRPKFKVADYVGKRPWNNARVMGASLYQPDLERFARAHACVGDVDIIEFMTILDERESDYDDLFLALDSLCSASGNGVLPVER